jgi:cytochrome b6-f complex iron-sulfur subunit
VANRNSGKATRRQFLVGILTLSLVGLIGQAGVALIDFLKPRMQAGTFGSKVSAGQAAEYQPGSVSHVRKGRYYISRLDDGGLLAMWQRCTHLGCTVPWHEDEAQFHCPCHNSIYTRTGEVVSGPAPRPLDIFPIEVDNGEVVVDTGHPIQRDGYDSSQATYV